MRDESTKGRKREERLGEVASEKSEGGMPKGRESRKAALREKNVLRTQGAVSTRFFPPARTTKTSLRL
ncbi:hypothetical protein RTBOTA2_006724 [Rhodotorula toruloides]|nr:hypothetical protein RTBOTA2_006724 [Rhodotorula toruloides]